jgi:hypothetical protein
MQQTLLLSTGRASTVGTEVTKRAVAALKPMLGIPAAMEALGAASFIVPF